MSVTLIKIITVGGALSVCFILRWQRHSIMRWLCPSEISLLESVEERKRVCDGGYVAFLKQWRTWITFVLYSAALACAALALSELAKTVTQGGQWRRAGAQLAVFLPVICEMLLIPLMMVLFRKSMRVYLRQYLNDHGIPICQNCGYDLRGQGTPRCPECGTPSNGKDIGDSESL